MRNHFENCLHRSRRLIYPLANVDLMGGADFNINQI